MSIGGNSRSPTERDIGGLIDAMAGRQHKIRGDKRARAEGGGRLRYEFFTRAKAVSR